MVSKRNFFAIFLMMFVVLFLCQFSQVMRDSLNQSNNDAYDGMDLPASSDVWSGVRSAELVIPEGCDMSMAAGRNVIFIGRTDGKVRDTVETWCGYTKTPMTVMDVLPLYSSLENKDNIMILIDGASVDPRCYIETVTSYVKHGATLVFCTLPEHYIIASNDKLKNLLGITEIVSDNVTVDGIRIFDGALIGGEAVYKVIYEEDSKYQDLDLSMPWYITAEGSKTYFIGMLDEDKYEREKFPRIIWRYTGGNIKVFAVNGDYMKTQAGLGILDMCLYESADYALYPVVNAQTSVFLDVPDFASENEEVMQSVYSRSSLAAQRDIFLPGIISVAESNDIVPTFMIQTGYDEFADPIYGMDDIDFYLEQINGLFGEAGRSLRHSDNKTLYDKLVSEYQIYRYNAADYHFRTAYTDDPEEFIEELSAGSGENGELYLGGIATICASGNDDRLFGYVSDDVTLQNMTQDASVYSYSRDLIARSLNTSVGYSSLMIDLQNTLCPQKTEDQWEIYFDGIFSNISTFWKRYNIYEQTTLSESDLRIRRMLSLDYESYELAEENGEKIILCVADGADDCWFLLRTHEQEISSISGGDYSRIEKNAYLIHVKSGEVTIHLTDSGDVMEYTNPFRDIDLLGDHE